ncbi:hypothetical protein [Hyphomonas sp.]|uniref:hypothetical protein n=1 Tax=Hyphomonas sp. TaxID=87 RepID=UPI0039197C70
MARSLAFLALGLIMLMPGLHARAHGPEAGSAFMLVCAEAGDTANPAIGRELAELLSGEVPSQPALPDDCKVCHQLCGLSVLPPADLTMQWPAPEASSRASRAAVGPANARGPPVGARGPPSLI